MKSSQPTPESLVWDKTTDDHMSRLDFARYFCQGVTGGLRCGAFTGGGKCQFHVGKSDTEHKQRVGKYSGYSRAFQDNKGSEEVNEQ